MKLKKLLITAAACVLALALLSIGTYAAAVSGIFTKGETDHDSYSCGETVTVTLSNKELADWAYTCNVSFDPELMECTGVAMKQGNTVLQNMTAYTGGVLTVYSTPEEANAGGKVGFALVDPAGATVSENDISAEITFKVIYDGDEKKTAVLTLNEDVAVASDDTFTASKDAVVLASLSLGSQPACEHVWADGTVTTEVVNGGTSGYTLTCSKCGEKKTVPYAGLYSATLILEGDVGVSFYAVLPQEASYVMINDICYQTAEAKSVTKTLDGSPVETSQFVYYVAAKEMNDAVSFRVYDESDNELHLIVSGADYIGTGYSYNARTYIRNKLNTDTANLSALVKALSDYGCCAQNYFGYNTDQLTEISIYGNLSEVTSDDLNAFAMTRSGTDPEGIRLYAASLVLESSTTIRVKYQLTGSSAITDYTFTVDGKKTVPVYVSNGIYAVEVPNVAAKDLGVMHTFTVSDGTNSRTLNYSALTYAYNKLNSSEEYMPELARALYLYNAAAKTYFEN